MRRIVLAAVWWCLWLLLPREAFAHQNSVTWATVEVEGRTVQTRFRIAALDLNEAMQAPAGHDVTRAEALVGTDRVARYLSARFRVDNMGHRCFAGDHAGTIREADGGFELVVDLQYVCPHSIERLSFRYDLFFDVDPHHQGMVTLRAFGGDAQQVFKRTDRDLTLGEPKPLRDQIAQYVTLGVEHIFIGYDHIAFLLGLVVIAGAKGLRRGARDVLAIVTAFTVAHSITLVSAALGWVTLSPRLVEPAIALSILVVAIENLAPREPRGRWALTFGFGLVHGFGFAGALAELGLPARATVPSLLAFNVGVELGQLTVVAAALPVLVLLREDTQKPWQLACVAIECALLAWGLHALSVSWATAAGVLGVGVPALVFAGRRWGYEKGVRRGGSIALAALSLLWLIERVSGHTVLRGALG